MLIPPPALCPDHELLARQLLNRLRGGLSRSLSAAERSNLDFSVVSHGIKHGCSAISEKAAISIVYVLRFRRLSMKLFAVRHISERYAGLAGACLSLDACDRAPDPASLRMIRPFRARRNWSVGSCTGDVAMDSVSDWLWVMLALGIFLPAGLVPFALARDACRWWRERRGVRSPSPAYEPGMPCARDDA
jgi:hypothetical protein